MQRLKSSTRLNSVLWWSWAGRNWRLKAPHSAASRSLLCSSIPTGRLPSAVTTSQPSNRVKRLTSWNPEPQSDDEADKRERKGHHSLIVTSHANPNQKLCYLWKIKKNFHPSLSPLHPSLNFMFVFISTFYNSLVALSSLPVPHFHFYPVFFLNSASHFAHHQSSGFLLYLLQMPAQVWILQMSLQ